MTVQQIKSDQKIDFRVNNIQISYHEFVYDTAFDTVFLSIINPSQKIIEEAMYKAELTVSWGLLDIETRALEVRRKNNGMGGETLELSLGVIKEV